MSSNITAAGESHGILRKRKGLLGMGHQSFRSAHTQETSHMHRFAEAMNTVQHPPTIAGEASGSQASDTLKEHDYIGLSDHSGVPQQHTQSENVGKELNIRRTELQLGLPGSPQNDTKDSAEAAACSKPQMGTFEHDKNESQQEQQQGIVEVRAKQQQRVDALPWHLKQQQEIVEKHVVGDAAEDSAAQPRAPVGWPPVQSFRKNSLPTPQTKPGDNASSLSAAAAAAPRQEAPVQPISSLFVKVYMDGVSIGRKVNLRTHGSYEKLSAALEEMFRRFINGQSANGHNKATKDSKLASDSKKLNFIYGSDYVLTYEDKDGDLMLVGDVPWGMFVGNVKRLRIMRGSEAMCANVL